MCSCGGSQPQNPSTGTRTPPGPNTGCTSCTVTVRPTPVNLCGAGRTQVLTATGTPAGGTFSWSSSATAVATVTGSGNTATVRGVAAGIAIITVTYNVAGCPPCTNTVRVKVCTCTLGRKYAFAAKNVAQLIGGKASIKTRYGRLCCEIEGCSTESAFHAVYENISYEGGGLKKWAQVGFSRRRNAGGTAVIQYRKAEIQGDRYFIDMDTAHAPAEGSVHEWKCELDPSSGTWSYYDNGASWITYQDDFWKTHFGNAVIWAGEILNREDDMPGTAGDKCSFTACQYRRNGHPFQDAGLVAGDLRNDDSNQWGAEFVSATAFNIWDKSPNT